MILSILQEIRRLFDRTMPGLSVQEQHLIILIAVAQRKGNALNMKQIVCSQEETATTVRRRVDGLQKTGYVERRMKENDGRSFVYSVTEPMMKRLMSLSGPLKKILREIEADDEKQRKKRK